MGPTPRPSWRARYKISILLGNGAARPQTAVDPNAKWLKTYCYHRPRRGGRVLGYYPRYLDRNAPSPPAPRAHMVPPSPWTLHVIDACQIFKPKTLVFFGIALRSTLGAPKSCEARTPSGGAQRVSEDVCAGKCVYACGEV